MPTARKALWVYECSEEHKTGQLSGNWNRMFDHPEPSRWGSTEYITSAISRRNIGLMQVGDLILAWQSDRHEAIGLAQVADLIFKGEWTELLLEPVERFAPPVNLLALKATRPQLREVKAFRLNSMAAIHATTADEARLLLKLCRAKSQVAVESGGNRSPRNSLGAPPRETKEVEQAAVKAVTQALRVKGWRVTSVEAKHGYGYDLEARKQGEPPLHVEVKGRSSDETDFIMTRNEWRQAALDPHFWLCLVTSARSARKRQLHWWSGKMLEDFVTEPLSMHLRADGVPESRPAL